MFGIVGLMAAVLIAGVVQITFGLVGLGWWVHSLPPAVGDGLMSGVGILILWKQLETLGILHPVSLSDMQTAIIIASVTIAVSKFWPLFLRKQSAGVKNFLARFPAPGVALLGAVVVAQVFGTLGFGVAFPHYDRISLSILPQDLTVGSFAKLDWTVLLIGASIAFLSGSKALLVSAAMHREDAKTHVNFNREIIVIGVGNILCGLVGGLPLTAHSERSQLMRMIGAKTRLSMALQSVWILTVPTLMPFLIETIPTAAFAGLIIFSGFKLIETERLLSLLPGSKVKKPSDEGVLFAATVFSTLVFGMVAGVVLGVLLGMLRLASKFASTAEIEVVRPPGSPDILGIKLRGAFTFVCVPQLVDATEDIPTDRVIVLDTSEVYYIDYACLSFFEDFKLNVESGGGHLHFDNAELEKKAKTPVNMRVAVYNELLSMDRRKGTRNANHGRRKMDKVLAAGVDALTFMKELSTVQADVRNEEPEKNQPAKKDDMKRSA
jgi:MFS superfamily sulfate permease-like transporter